ncbi:hypothetical protein [Clavibacter tessellarius]|uniref:hypothetical protein n=1 Tax=Clavibacter tessellarius TaxID=31965 RepID=UPI003245F0DB
MVDEPEVHVPVDDAVGHAEVEPPAHRRGGIRERDAPARDAHRDLPVPPVEPQLAHAPHAVGGDAVVGSAGSVGSDPVGGGAGSVGSSAVGGRDGPVGRARGVMGRA